MPYLTFPLSGVDNDLMDKQRRSFAKQFVYGIGVVIGMAGLIQVVRGIWLHEWIMAGIAAAILAIGSVLMGVGEGTSWHPFSARLKDKD